MERDMEALYWRVCGGSDWLNNGNPDPPRCGRSRGVHGDGRGVKLSAADTHYPGAFVALVRCCRDYEWVGDAEHGVRGTGYGPASVGSTGCPVWTFPGHGFQYREPPEEAAFMREDV
jgi:hypothetical protein